MKILKPRFWSDNNIISYLLLPLTIITIAVNRLKKLKKKFKPEIPTICVGNIYLGGTGKTQLVLKLNYLLSKIYKISVIKKYYKDQFDEQKLLRNRGEVFITNNRIDALHNAEMKGYEVAILDDGLQDSSINCDLNFVCFNNINWIGNGMTIPSGPLREKINNLKKYDHMFLNGNLENVEKLKEKILKINPTINIHLGKYNLLNIENFDKNEKYLIFSGIGNHQTFVSMLKNHGLIIVKDIEFPDHYNYSRKDLDVVIDKAKYLNSKIITTEKDYVRFKNFGLNEIKYIKSRIEILDEEKFIKSII